MKRLRKKAFFRNRKIPLSLRGMKQSRGGKNFKEIFDGVVL